MDNEERARIAFQNLLRRRSKHPTPRAATTPNEDDEREFTPPTVEFVPLCVRVNVAAQMIGLGKTKIYELIDAGEIETLKVGKSTLVTVDSLKTFVQRRLRGELR